MRQLGFAVALAGAIGFGGLAQAAPASGTIGAVADQFNVIEKTQYVYGGYSHCWYRSGWKGPGWYRCGYRWRTGYGYGGPVGWNGWVAPGVAVVAPAPVVVAPVPGVVVTTGPYFYNGRHWHHRAWRGGRYVYW